MVAAQDLKFCGVSRVGSSPTSRTSMLGNSTVECSAVNRVVVGSIPTLTASRKTSTGIYWWEP